MTDRAEELSRAAAYGTEMAAQTDALFRSRVEHAIDTIRAVDESRRLGGVEPGEASPEIRRTALGALLGFDAARARLSADGSIGAIMGALGMSEVP